MMHKHLLPLLLFASFTIVADMQAMNKEKETEETKSELEKKKRKKPEERQSVSLQAQAPIQNKKQKLIFPYESTEARKSKSLLDRAEESVICYALNSIPQESGERLVKKELFFSNSLLHKATHKEDIQKLIEAGADPNAKNLDEQTVFNYYINQGRENEAHALLSIVGTKLNVKSSDIFRTTPLMNAIKIGDIELAKNIIDILEKQEQLKNLNQDNIMSQTALTLSVRCMPELIELLVKKGAQINPTTAFDVIPLFICINYNSDFVETLIDLGANVNFHDDTGVTPLMHAARYNEKVINVLISKGAPSDPENEDGETALIIAAEHNTNAIDPLIRAGASVDFETSQDETALMRAAKVGNIPSLEKLLEHGADINRPNRTFTFALTAAIESNQNTAITYLLEHKAQVHTIDLARAANKPDIQALLTMRILPQHIVEKMVEK